MLPLFPQFMTLLDNARILLPEILRLNEPRHEKPDFCICENKDADQLSGNCEADQCLCFRYTDSTIPLLSKSEIIFCGCTGWFVSDLVGNPEGRFSHNEAQIITTGARNYFISYIPLSVFIIKTVCVYTK